MATIEWQPRRDAFTAQFGAAPQVGVLAPGRVNLIGDHTDYHEGFVLPMAIDRTIAFTARRRTDRRLRIYSQTLQAGVEMDLDADERHPEQWAQYFQGVVQVLAAQQRLTAGCDVLIDGDLPPGGGLSSSSALVVGFAALVAQLEGVALEPLALARIGRDAEHWYGTTGGIMDQFVISHARAGRAVLLDCRTLRHDLIALPPGVAVVIANTGTQHNQIVSPFAERRRQAEAALRVLQTITPEMATLRDVEPARLERYHDALLQADPDGVLWRRCAHVVGENARVVEAAGALTRGDVAAAGRLLAGSHASLRDNYEVSSPELDTMVETAWEGPGCLGARMTGGGFGGCTVNLVAGEKVDAFCQWLSDHYARATSIRPAVFTTVPSDGVRTIPLD